MNAACSRLIPYWFWTWTAMIMIGLAASSCFAEVSFNDDIRPILSDRCFFCHGPDKEQRKAGLRLDLREAAVAPNKHGRTAVAPGAPDASEIVRRLFSDDPDEVMPPPDSKLEISANEKALIKQWIAEGARYEGHWAFQAPKQVEPPENEGSTAVDRFLLERLKPLGFTFESEAPRERLIRRLSFDLTGLPPTPEEVAAFVANDEPSAYETLVDELLSRETYGERMAAEWMDVARYSDSFGYQVDRDRFVWPWRDWVIKAFNGNQRYDDFITWQLAGDLLPDATDEQILATTFNRLHSQKVEGGSVPEEFRVEYVADRTHTFGTAFLGLTLECSRCHDHKYDPITQKEYYQLSSFFANIDEAGLYSYFTDAVPTPTLMLMDEAKKAEVKALEHAVAEEEKALAETAQNEASAFEKWLGNAKSVGVPGCVGEFPFDAIEGNQLANLAKPDAPATTESGNRLVEGKHGQAIQLSGDDVVNFSFGNYRRHDAFSIGLWLQTPDVKERAVVFHRSAAWTDAASRGYEMLIEDGRLSAALIHYWPGNALRVQMNEPLPLSLWTHVTMTYDGSSRAEGLRLYVNGRLAETTVVRDHLVKNITGGGGDNLAIGQRFRDRGFTEGLVDDFRVFERQLTPLEVNELANPGTLEKALSRGTEASQEERQTLSAYYLSVVSVPYQNQLSKLRSAREKRNATLDAVPEIMVMRERPEPLVTHVLNRGAYDAPGDAVVSDTPSFLLPMPEGPRDRLTLARWLTNPEHPLTSRVLVNRYWQLFFGRGLVSTPEDFGSQGKRPTHPKLLDWLARDFTSNGWNLKRLVKQMVMSQAYRQDSRITPEKLAADPENLWLGRAPRYRWAAEMLRDQALAASGLLVRTIGGGPVRPYEVAAAFKPVDHDKGEGLYRRSLYTYWKRTSPAPVMIALDAPSREVCSARRDITSTPLQAFVFMNDPQMVEASRVLAQRLLLACGDDIDAVVNRLYQTLLSRAPEPREIAVMKRLYAEQLDHFRAQGDELKAFLGNGLAPSDPKLKPADLAAAAIMVNALFSFDECVMKR